MMMRRLWLIGVLACPALLAAQRHEGRLCVPGSRAQRDSVKRVPSKSEILAAWQRRESAIRAFQFSWTEEQTHPRGWIANPRYAERERLAAPTVKDRPYVVKKTLIVSPDTVRYEYTFDRRGEGDTTGNGDQRHYSYRYESVFDGRRATARATSLNDTPETIVHANEDRDAQNLDMRPFFLAFRPLDPVLGDLLVDRAVTNLARAMYRGRSTSLLEERRDPLGWKTILWIEPERDYLVSRFVLIFENTCVIDMDIDYDQDARIGWIPSGWRITELLADGSWRLVTTAKVTSRRIDVR